MYTSLITQIFAFGTLLLQIIFLVFLIFIAYPKLQTKINTNLLSIFNKNLLLIYFIITMIGVVGSLTYSEVVGLLPCGLCWWQRLFLYPQALIVLVAMIKKHSSKQVFEYGFWLSVIGGLIAFYHYVSQLSGVVREIGTKVLGACGFSSAEPSCYDVSFIALGYITIPMMALTVYIGLILIYIYYKNQDKKSNFFTNFVNSFLGRK